MKNRIIRVIPLFFLFIVIGCKGVYEEKITGRYYLVATDYVQEDMSLNFQLDDNTSYGVIGATVFSIGFDQDYIVAKQHPSNDRTTTNYYIVRIYQENTLWAEKGVNGPLNLTEFVTKQKELGLEDLRFTKQIHDLE